MTQSVAGACGQVHYKVALKVFCCKKIKIIQTVMALNKNQKTSLFRHNKTVLKIGL